MPISFMPSSSNAASVLSNVPAGSWWSDQNHTPTVANTPIVLTLNHTDFERYTTLVSGSGIKVKRAGLYNLQWSAQIYNSDGGGSTAHAEVWLRKNGVDVPGSAGRISVTTNNRYALPAWNYYLSLAVDDVIELVYQNSNVGIDVVYLTSNGTPGTASLLVTISQVA